MDIHLSQCVLAVEEESRELAENYQKHNRFCCCNVNYKGRGDEKHKPSGNFNSFQKEVIIKEGY